MRLSTILAVGVLLGCGARDIRDDEGPELSTGESGGESDSPTEPVRATAAAHLALELTEGNKGTLIRIVITDEVGSTSRKEIGEFAGECVEISEDIASGSLLLGAKCESERGVLLHVVYRAPTVSVLRDWTDDSEVAFDPILQFDLPGGARVTTDFANPQ